MVVVVVVVIPHTRRLCSRVLSVIVQDKVKRAARFLFPRRRDHDEVKGIINHGYSLLLLYSSLPQDRKYRTTSVVVPYCLFFRVVCN